MKLKELKVVPTKGKSKEELQDELSNEGFDFYEWSDLPGAYYPPHHHKYDECICVVDGQMTFVVNNKEYELSSGEKLYLPAFTIHESKNRRKGKVTYLIGEMH